MTSINGHLIPINHPMSYLFLAEQSKWAIINKTISPSNRFHYNYIEQLYKMISYIINTNYTTLDYIVINGDYNVQVYIQNQFLRSLNSCAAFVLHQNYLWFRLVSFMHHTWLIHSFSQWKLVFRSPIVSLWSYNN